MTRIGVTRWEDVAGEAIERYWQRLRDAGLEPVDLHDGGSSLHGLRGLVLTGGVDIDPSHYGDERHEKVRRTEPDRDEFEIGLLDEALRQDLPVLAICRGHQLVNVALGGSLLQHIESGLHVADYRSEGYPSRSHPVELTPGSRLGKWLGEGRVTVNSRHHQAVTPDRLAPGLIATAMSDDGLVEAMESASHAWLVGVQWHPERDELQITGFAARSRRLFEELARVAASV